MPKNWRKEGRNGSKAGDVITAVKVTLGDAKALTPGRSIARLVVTVGSRQKMLSVYSIGPVQIGTQRYTGGVIPSRNDIFLCRNGRTWRLAKYRLACPAPARPAGRYAGATKDDIRLWADACARLLVDSVCPTPNVEMVNQVCLTYRARVKELVERACRRARDFDLERRPIDYARAICSDWIDIDLTDMRVPSVNHALHVSLVLALEPVEAVELICLGGLMEHQVPIMDEATARVMYQQAVRLLAQLCPAWWSQGPMTDWTKIGSIDLLFRNQWSRMLALAQERQVSVSSIAGFHWSGRRQAWGIPPSTSPADTLPDGADDTEND